MRLQTILRRMSAIEKDSREKDEGVPISAEDIIAASEAQSRGEDKGRGGMYDMCDAPG